MAQSHPQVSIETPCLLRGLMNEKKISEVVSYRTPRSLESTCTVFNKEYNLPRPPENLDELDNNVENHTHIFADESSNSSFLIQMFLSELQENDTPAVCPLTGPVTEGETTTLQLAQKDVELESDNFCTGTETIFPQPVMCAKSCRDNSEVVCSATESMLNPLDDPFVSHFTDISTLEATLLHQNTVSSMSANCTPNSPAIPCTPKSVNDSSTTVDVHTMLSSTTCEDTGMFDLSECVNFLSTPLSSEFPSTPASSVSSPVSTLSSSYELSSPVDSLQAASLLKDFDFSSFSTQDLQNVISNITNFDEPQSESTSCDISAASSPISVGIPALPGPIDTDFGKTSRKRKRSEAAALESLPIRSKRLSSDSSSSSVSMSEDQPLSTEQKKALRREKNNAASVVSRAKRRQRCKNIHTREKELEAANAELREKVEWLTAETKKFREMLLHKLSQ